MRYREGVAGYAGLQHCGSVWSCPVCSAQIRTERALEIGAVLGQAVSEGHSLGFVTFTMRHKRGQSLRLLWGGAGRAWKRALQGKRWVKVQLDYGVVGWVRVWEVTDGRNGWHVHVHFVLVLPKGATSTDLDAVAGDLYGRWSKGLQAAGLEAPRLVGQEWHLAAGDDAAGSLADYLFKLAEQAAPAPERAKALGLELAHTLPGRTAEGLRTRPVWSILDEAATTGDLSRWHEWEKGSKGRRQVAWSKGLRERFAPDLADVDDEDIVERELGSASDDVLRIRLDGWKRLCSTPSVLPLLLEVMELHGRRQVAEVLDELGVPYELVEVNG
jgi:hypothetical protein